MESQLAISLDHGVLSLRFDRPEKKNAITNAMYAAMADALARANTDAEVGAVLFEGSREIFTSGNDLSTFLNASSQHTDWPVVRFIRGLIACDRPMIAAVHGPAIGIGATMLLHCDLVYMAPTAYLHMPFTELATVPEAGASFLLMQRYGRQIAGELLIAGSKISSARALTMGLVNDVIPEVELDGRVREAARLIARKPRDAMAETKRLMRGDDTALRAHVDREIAAFAACLGSAEMQGVIAAKLARKAAG